MAVGEMPQPVQVLLTALVIVADWIASNADLFPYFSQDVARSSEERVAAAWRGLDLPAPWCPDEPTGDAQELFAARFDLPPGAKVRPVQETVVELARAMLDPGLMVIEAPMGEGTASCLVASPGVAPLLLASPRESPPVLAREWHGSAVAVRRPTL
ncbi:HD domain-containing protein [Streptomyces sp. NPDC057486]|uniref:HD domain-containing protein n=1 Tax=Streptomyces sp. NPDC057486 TaxID=3346145 RepID=UPI0036CBD626